MTIPNIVKIEHNLFARIAVKQDNFRVIYQASGNSHSLLLPSGQHLSPKPTCSKDALALPGGGNGGRNVLFFN